MVELYRQAKIHGNKTQFLCAYFDGRADALVLDIGCWGQGFDHRDPLWPHGMIRKRVRHCVGIDTQGDVKEIRRMGLNFHRANAEDFSIDEQFDVIYAGDVVEHLSNLGQFLNRMRNHLAPGGEILISTPNPYFLTSMLQKFYRVEPSTNPEHTCLFNVRTFIELSSRHDLTIDRSELLRLLGVSNLSTPIRVLNTVSRLATSLNKK